MNFPQLRVLAVSAASLAIVTGISTTAASAATTANARSSRPAASPAAAAGAISAPVTGSFTNADGTGTFTGAFTPAKFEVVNGALQATGLLTGRMVDANGSTLGTVSQTVTETVVTNATSATRAPSAVATCSILNLVLGPLHLNLLGLVVDLNQVNLIITAVPGAGALLGNLLCSVTSLLDGVGTLAQIAALLNQILGLL
jgi:hypothetical protein